jgi:hypothetical protein
MSFSNLYIKLTSWLHTNNKTHLEIYAPKLERLKKGRGE